jgi:hypothetical protein
MSKYCNWTYTGEFDYRSSGSYIKSAQLETDCGETVTWTRDNKIGKLFQQYERQVVPMGMDFYIECPYCHKILNIVNPFDDGETWRKNE